MSNSENRTADIEKFSVLNMKIICIGRNYAKHIEELGNKNPEEPVFFLKPDSAILLQNNPFVLPSFSTNVHFEVEVLVKINKVGKHISPKFAPKYYDEIGLGIDFTARDIQDQCREKGLPWEKAKAFDGSAALGTFFPKEQFENVDNLPFQLYKNNELMQDGNTEMMLWKIDELIAYVSQFLTLKKGDILFTGTPAGVGKIEEKDVLRGVLAGQESFEFKVR